MPKISVIYTAYNQLPFFREKILPALERQTFKDFEVVVGDDGSSDFLASFLQKKETSFPVKYVWQKDDGYGYTSIVNKAVNEMASGEYLVFLSGDTFPSETFLEEMARSLKPERIVNGLRVNVDPSGVKVSDDWRLRFLPHFERMMMKQGTEMFPLQGYPTPWVHFTMNTLGCSRRIWDAVGGLTPNYDGGYGKMDWSFCMKAFFSGFSLWWNTAAIAFTEDDGKPGRPDAEKNTEFFEDEIEEWKNKSKNKV